MKIMKSGKVYLNIYQMACYICLLIVAMPVVNYYCNWYVTLLPFLFICYRLVKYKSTFKEVVILMGMAIIFTLIEFWGVYRNQDFFMWLIDGIIVWLPCLIAIYIKNGESDKFTKKYVQAIVAIMTITSITTIIGLIMYPQASRELASGTEIYDTTKYLLRNIGGYEHIYALVVLIPVMLWLIKNNEKMLKVFNIICMVVNLYCIYRSQYTIAIISAIVILLFLFAQKHKKTVLVMLVIVAVSLFIGGTDIMTFLSKVFLVLSKNIGLDYVKDRMLQVSQLFQGVTIATETSADRIEYYQNCWKGFLKSPIWGNNFGAFSENNVSGHSMVLDMLSGMGLIGFASVLCLFLISIRTLIKSKIKEISGTVIITWSAFILVSILNPSSFMTIFMILFVGSVCIQRMEKQNESFMGM